MSSYEVKWKGRRSGPYSLEELQRKFEAREVGGMHEVYVDGQWMTVRSFFRRNPPVESQTAYQEVSEAGNATQSVLPAPHVQSTSSVNLEASSRGKSRGRSSPNYQERAVDPGHCYYAGFWIRAMALLLDGLLLVWAPLWTYDYFQETSILTMETLKSLSMIQWVIVGLAGSIAGWIYFTLFEVSPLRGSPGKKIVGLSVSLDDGTNVKIGTAALRNLAKIGSGLMLGVGFFISLFSPRGQTFHDLISHTVVSQKLSEANVFPIRS